MKHRHKLSQRQRQRASSPNRRSEFQEALDEQPHSNAGKARKRTAHQMPAEGGRTKHRLDKFRRGGRRTKRFDDGGPAGSTAGSTRSADDPGGELATATKERKGTLGRMSDELLGPRPAYKHGGRQRPRRYDDGGDVGDASNLAPSADGSSFGSGFGSALSNLGSGLATMAKARGSGPPPVPVPSSPAPQANNPGFIRQQQSAQKSQAVLARIKALESAGQKSMIPGQPKIPGNKKGGRIDQREAGRRK
jgi:hypothetical protein